MDSSKPINYNNIKYLLGKLVVFDPGREDIIMINKGIITDFLNSLPTQFIEDYLKKIDLKPPIVESEEFRVWVVNTRLRHNMTQTALAKAIGARPEQISCSDHDLI